MDEHGGPLVLVMLHWVPVNSEKQQIFNSLELQPSQEKMILTTNLPFLQTQEGRMMLCEFQGCNI